MEKNKKIGIIVGVIIVLVIAAGVGVGVFYTNGIKAVGVKENVEFTVEAGDNKIQIVDKLAKAGIIKNKYATLLYVFTHSSKNLQAGNYSLSKNWDAKKIIDTIADGKIINPVKTVKITFVEGKRFNEYAEQIAKTFNMNYDDIIAISYIILWKDTYSQILMNFLQMYLSTILFIQCLIKWKLSLNHIKSKSKNPIIVLMNT